MARISLGGRDGDLNAERCWQRDNTVGLCRGCLRGSKSKDCHGKDLLGGRGVITKMSVC